jgi:hypothetical protein
MLLVAVLALVLVPAAMATSVLPLGTSDFTITGKQKSQWKGAKGLTAAIAVDDAGADYAYTVTIRAKGNKQLNRSVSRVVFGLSDASSVTVNGKALTGAKVATGSLSKVGGFSLPAAADFASFKVGGKKKIVLKFNSTDLPAESFLFIRGANVQAFASGDFASALVPTSDETTQPEDDVVDNGGGSEQEANVVPLPAAAWAGLSMLGGMGLIHRIRRSRTA